MSVLNSFSLQGKTALVTGCNKGIGFGMTLALAEAGANIIGMSSGGDFADIQTAVVKARWAQSNSLAYVLANFFESTDLQNWRDRIQR